MEKAEYILVTNLTKAETARRLLSDMDIDDGRNWIRRAETLIAIDEMIVACKVKLFEAREAGRP